MPTPRHCNFQTIFGKPESMSLPTPHIQALSSYRTPRNEASDARNVSSPFSLAIPLRTYKSMRRPWPGPSIQHRPRDRSKYEARADESKKSDFLEVPKRPKKAVIIVDSRVLHGNSPYELATNSTSPSSSQSNHDTSKKAKEVGSIKERLNDRIVALAVTLTLALLLAIGIPLGIILPQKYMTPLPVNVLMPFYMNPADGTWQRLYDTVVKHQDIKFTIIINPSDGPGNITWPASAFIEAIKLLNVYPNVCILGYINTLGGTRDNAIVRSEITTYAGWSHIAKDMALHGIYLDQTPWRDDTNGTAKAYLRNVSATVRHTNGWATGEGAEGLVVHNPGRLPDSGLMAYKPDMIVIFNGTYAELPTKEALTESMKDSKMKRDDFAMLVKDVPRDLGRGGLRRIVETLRREVEWLYVTDLKDDAWLGYPSFLDEWLDLTW